MAGGVPTTNNVLRSLVEIVPRDYRDRWRKDLENSVSDAERILANHRKILDLINEVNAVEDSQKQMSES